MQERIGSPDKDERIENFQNKSKNWHGMKQNESEKLRQTSLKIGYFVIIMNIFRNQTVF